MRIAVCLPQVPFAWGGAEILSERLVDELRARDHQAELVTVPFKWYPGERVLTQAFLWRLLDLEESDGRPIDLVIATKFPSYAVKASAEGRLAAAPVPAGVRARRHRSRAVRPVARGPRPAAGCPPARPAGARGGALAVRDLRQRGGAAGALHRPDRGGTAVPTAGARVPLRRVRRLRALGRPARPGQARRPAAGGARRAARRCAASSPATARTGTGSKGSRGRADSTAAPSSPAASPSEELTDLYARCLAVYYAPVDEDFGFVPYEAFLAEKPVVTTADAGGPLEVVKDHENGLVCEPAATALAEACSWLGAHPEDAQAWGQAGRRAAELLSWDRVIERLLA